MALDIKDESYNGTYLAGFISLATTGFDTVKKGCMNVLSGIKFKATVPTIRVKNFIQAHKPTPTHGGVIEVDGRQLEPQKFMGYIEFNPSAFETHWESTKMNPQLLDAELPKTAESAIVQEVIKGNDSYLDVAVWQSIKDPAAITTALASGLDDGDNNLIFFDGLMTKMYNDINVVKIATPVALTEANIFDKMKAVKLKVPKRNKQNPNLKYLVSYNTAEIFENAQQGQNFKGASVTDAGKMTFGGKQVVPCAGIPDDTIVATIATLGPDSNLWLGVNEVNEQTYLKIAALAANSENWFMKMLLMIDTNYGYGEDIVLYTTWTE